MAKKTWRGQRLGKVRGMAAGGRHQVAGGGVLAAPRDTIVMTPG